MCTLHRLPRWLPPSSPCPHIARTEDDSDDNAPRGKGGKSSKHAKRGGGSGSGGADSGALLLASRRDAGMPGHASAAAKPLWRRVVDAAQEWVSPTVKLNGKKLVASNRAVLTAMIPLIVWASGVVAVFGISYVQLRNLKEPLMSLAGVATRGCACDAALGSLDKPHIDSSMCAASRAQAT